MKSWIQMLATVVCAMVLAACGGGGSNAPASGSAPVTSQPAFKSIDSVAGTGPAAVSKDVLVVNYVGYLYDPAKADFKGAKFDSSLDRNKPFTFTLGASQVIAGWEQGVAGMKVGGKRTLIIPAQLAYGATPHAAQPPIGDNTYAAIPANAALVFDIELVKINPTSAPQPITTLQIKDSVIGTGPAAAKGNVLTVRYTGYLYDASRTDLRGGVFDSATLKSITFDFKLGDGYVIAGWDQGLIGMQVGGKRTLIVPPDLGYGNMALSAQPPFNGVTFVAIPANAVLIFDIELVSMK